MKNKTEKPLHWVFAGAIAGVIGFISGRSLWLQTDLNLLMSIVCGVLVTLFTCFMFYKPLQVIKACADSIRAAKQAVREAKEEKRAHERKWATRRLRLYDKMIDRINLFQSLFIGINYFLWGISASLWFVLLRMLHSTTNLSLSQEIIVTTPWSLIVSTIAGLFTYIGSRNYEISGTIKYVLMYWYYDGKYTQRETNAPFRRTLESLCAIDFGRDGYAEQRLHDHLLSKISVLEINGVKYVGTKFRDICKFTSLYYLCRYSWLSPIGFVYLVGFWSIQFLLDIVKRIPKRFTLTSLWVRTFTLSMFIQLNTQARIAIISCAGVGYIGGWMAELAGYQQAALISFGVGLVFGLVQHFVYGLFSDKIKALHRALLIRRIRIA